MHWPALGDITLPYIKGELLRVECAQFLDCIRKRKTSLSDGWNGGRVVKVLDAKRRSLHSNDKPVLIVL